MNSNEKEFCGIVDGWERVINGRLYDFETLYNYLFMSKIGTPVAKRLLSLVPFEWYDPDTSYEEDVMAFINAAKEKRDEIRSQKQTVADIIEEVINSEEELSWHGWIDSEMLAEKIAKRLEAE